MLWLYMFWIPAIKMWKKSIGSFLFIGFPQIFYPFSAFFQCIPLPFLPQCTLLNSYYTPLLITLNMNHTWIASNNVLFSMSCYYHSQMVTPYLAQILGFWVTCGDKMMSLCHGWGCQPPQTASCIHIRHVQSVWAHWYAIHRHMVAALHMYTLPTWLSFWGSG